MQGAGRQRCPLAFLPNREAQAATLPPSPGSPDERVAPTVEAGRAQTDARSSRGAWTRGSAVAEGGWRGSWAPALRLGLHSCLGLGNLCGRRFPGEVSLSPQPLATVWEKASPPPVYNHQTTGMTVPERTRPTGIARKRKLQRNTPPVCPPLLLQKLPDFLLHSRTA